jgi:hypothetical protein
LLAACAFAAISGLSLAACGGSASGGTSSGNAAPAAASAASATPAAPSGSAAPGGSSAPSGAGHLTAPGTHLGFGQVATVAWVPPSADATSAQKGFKLQVTVESIQKGSIADFRNVELSASERHTTPYYVTLRIKALGRAAPHGSDDPAISFDAIDDRGQQQQSITFLGTFRRCNETQVPKPFAAGKTYRSCLAYLMPGGGSIRQVQWGDGPHSWPARRTRAAWPTSCRVVAPSARFSGATDRMRRTRSPLTSTTLWCGGRADGWCGSRQWLAHGPWLPVRRPAPYFFWR